MGIGRAREGGVEVDGTSKLLGYGQFEEHAGGWRFLGGWGGGGEVVVVVCVGRGGSAVGPAGCFPPALPLQQCGMRSDGNGGAPFGNRVVRSCSLTARTPAPPPPFISLLLRRAGSKVRRPAEHTHTSSSRTLQGLQLMIASDGGGSGGGRAQRKAAAEPALDLLEDENDDLCHACGLGVSAAWCNADTPGRRDKLSPAGGRLPCMRRVAAAASAHTHHNPPAPSPTHLLSSAQGHLLCCETCPAVYHPSCVGLQAPPDGDFYCPACRCTQCGDGGSGASLVRAAAARAAAVPRCRPCCSLWLRRT